MDGERWDAQDRFVNLDKLRMIFAISVSNDDSAGH
jgi:hypothetical protein